MSELSMNETTRKLLLRIPFAICVPAADSLKRYLHFSLENPRQFQFVMTFDLSVEYGTKGTENKGNGTDHFPMIEKNKSVPFSPSRRI